MVARLMWMLPVLLLAWTRTCQAQVDNTRVSGSVGTTVVTRCVNLIGASNLFVEDYSFLRRIAYVETRDGATLTTNNTGGIWQLSATEFSNINLLTYNLTSYYDDIYSNFAINWTNVVYADLDIPLYSALAARLLLAYQEQQGGVIPSTVSEQHTYYIGFYLSESLSSPSVTLAAFETLVAEISSTCTVKVRDVIAVIDSSSHISAADYNLTLDFLISLLPKFDIASVQMRIGIIQYSSETTTVLQLSEGITSAAVTTAISAMQPTGNTAVLTGIAIGTATDYFGTSYGGRGSSASRVMLVITGYTSTDTYTTQVADAATAGVDIVGIGVSSNVLSTEITSIAGAGDSFHVSNFSLLSTLTTTIQDVICAEHIDMTDNTEVTGSISPGESQAYQISAMALSLNLQTSAGTAQAYCSEAIESPSSALYDFTFNSTSDGSVPYNYTATSSTLYMSIECTSSTATSYTLSVGTPAVTTTAATTAAAVTSTTATAAALTQGEIAGIVFAALVFVCAIAVVIVYMCCIGRGNKKLMKPLLKDKHDEPKLDDIPMTERGQVSDRRASDARKRLRVAVTNAEPVEVKSALADFRMLRLEDPDNLIIQAERIIARHDCKEGLAYAIQKRSIRHLQRAVFNAKQQNFQESLKEDVHIAEKLLHDLILIQNLLKQLRVVIMNRDLEESERIIERLKQIGGFDQSGIDRMLDTLRCKDDLDTSVRERDVELATTTIAVVEEKGYENDLHDELTAAKKMQQELAYLEKVRKDVLNLNQSRVSEIRSYAKPPAGVRNVMTAVYIILGYDDPSIKEWNQIQALMAKTGQDSLRRQILDIDPRFVDYNRAMKAKMMVGSFDIKAIQDLSIGLSLFYVFIKSVISEVENMRENQLPATNYDKFTTEQVLR